MNMIKLVNLIKESGAPVIVASDGTSAFIISSDEFDEETMTFEGEYNTVPEAQKAADKLNKEMGN